jgi:phosphonate C-P lyase system protein PhnH
VFDTQAVYRKLLRAAANPGREEIIMKQAEKLRAPNTVMLTLAVTLLDNRTGFFAVGIDGGFIRDFSFAPETPAEDADFAFVGAEMSSRDIAELISKVRGGTLESPEFSCTLFIAYDELKAGRITLSGPGIPGAREAPLGGYAAQWLEARDSEGFLYPCGFDLFFVNAAGGVTAVPRLCKFGIMD